MTLSAVIAAFWLRDPTIASAIFTGGIFIATAVYAFFTWQLWTATRQSADAARASAEAAKKSADLLAALHRPYLGVLRVHSSHDPVKDVGFWLEFEIENFGTLPATDVWTRIALSLDGKPFNEVQWPSRELFPQALDSGGLSVRLTEQMQTAIRTRDKFLLARVQIDYRVPGGGAYRHQATFKFETESRQFRLDESQTEQVP